MSWQNVIWKDYFRFSVHLANPFFLCFTSKKRREVYAKLNFGFLAIYGIRVKIVLKEIKAYRMESVSFYSSLQLKKFVTFASCFSVLVWSAQVYSLRRGRSLACVAIFITQSCPALASLLVYNPKLFLLRFDVCEFCKTVMNWKWVII